MIDKGILTAVDANINRCIEGLRVCEDIFRFYLHHPVSSEIKELRHSIASLSGIMMQYGILYYRDVDNDAQKFIDTPGELKRSSVSDVFRSNIRRAAESARALEEFTKMIDLSVSSEFQKLRFTVYDIEKQGWSILEKSDLAGRFRNSFYAVIDSSYVDDRMIEETAEILAGSGADIIQLRMRNRSGGDYLHFAERIASICRKNNTIFIVNDRVDIALLCGAHGIHFEHGDLPPGRMKELSGEKLLKGYTAVSTEMAEYCIKTGIDYLTVDNTREVEGVELVNNICAIAEIPVIASVDIKNENINDLLDAGCSGVALILRSSGNDNLHEIAVFISEIIKRIKSR